MTTLKIQPLAVDQTGDFYFNTVTANNLLVNTVNVYDSIVGANANIALLFLVNNYQNTTITNVNTYATSAYGQANIATTLAQAAFDYANTLTGGSGNTSSGFSKFITPTGNTFSASQNTQVQLYASGGVSIDANATGLIISSATPFAVDWGLVTVVPDTTAYDFGSF